VEPEIQHAPPVVAVVVVHEPGDWFEESIDAFAEQDYPNLRFLFLVASSPDSDETARVVEQVEALVADRLESAFVRSLDANTGFGVAANEVLRLVEGQNGFFLFCHDDVAPDPDAVRVMVEELYRSNAGIVGPKIVEWDDPGVLISVGLGVDRFGEVNQEIEPGEVDQEQHDGVRDVFVLPSACMLVRADLFRELGGFDPAIEFYGDDVELCWRAHHSGARVVVAPIARVRHRGELVERRPDLNHVAREARSRLRTVVTLTGAARLPGRVLELLILTIAEMVVGVFTGRFRQGWASMRALVGLVPRLPSIVARRRAVSSLRQVPEREVLGLQDRGSARLSRFLRTREPLAAAGEVSASSRRWRESTTAPAIAWIAVLVLLIAGSRSLLTGGIAPVGEFLRFPESPGDLFDAYRSGWNPNGLGETTPNPTGWAALSVMSVTTLFRMGLLHTIVILGMAVVGMIGVWKLATVFPSTRARIGALVVYAGSPLIAGAYSSGAFDVLVAVAAVPWMIHTLRRAVGLETADPRLAAASDVVDGIIEISWPERLRRTAQFGLVVALATAFEPVLLLIALGVGLLLAVGTLLALASWRTAIGYLGSTVIGSIVAAALNLPWISTWSWSGLVGASPIGDPGRGLADLAAFQIGETDFAFLVFAWYVPVVAAVLLGRAWRLTWAVRSGALVVGFGTLAVFGDQGRLPFDAPTAGVLLVPVAVGLAISAASALAAFDLDVRDGSFGWRQPLGLAASAAVVVGLVPGIVALGPGDWSQPSSPLSRLVEAQLPDVPDDGLGDYHVLLLGDARTLPVPAVEYRNGVSFAVVSDDPLDTRARWAPTDSGREAIVTALDQIATGSTLRAGRLLAPLGIRFVIVPEFDGVVSTTADPLELPLGIIESFDEQLDIVSFVGLTTLRVYENASWLPTYSLLEGETAEASRGDGLDALVRSDLSEATPIFNGADSSSSLDSEVAPGVVHVAVPFDENWSLEVGGESLEPRVAFGVSIAFDVESAGVGTLSYSTPSSRSAWLLLQFVLWGVALFAASRVSIPLARRSGPLVSDETLITFDPESDGDVFTEPPTGLDPGLDMTEQIAVQADRNLQVDDAADVGAGVAAGVDADDDADHGPHGAGAADGEVPVGDLPTDAVRPATTGLGAADELAWTDADPVVPGPPPDAQVFPDTPVYTAPDDVDADVVADIAESLDIEPSATDADAVEPTGAAHAEAEPDGSTRADEEASS